MGSEVVNNMRIARPRFTGTHTHLITEVYSDNYNVIVSQYCCLERSSYGKLVFIEISFRIQTERGYLYYDDQCDDTVQCHGVPF